MLSIQVQDIKPDMAASLGAALRGKPRLRELHFEYNSFWRASNAYEKRVWYECLAVIGIVRQLESLRIAAAESCEAEVSAALLG